MSNTHHFVAMSLLSVPHVSPRPTHTRAPPCPLSHPYSLPPLSLYSKHPWRSSTIPPTLEALYFARGRCRRASPSPGPPFPRRRPRRRQTLSLFFIFSKPSRMNSIRSTPTLLYSNKWPFARALLVAGELPSPCTFLLVPSFKIPSSFMAFHH